ncbi:MAG: hypothetical protein E6Q97_00910 [Desulfurellales bacterium]|nr:MAG: hypothetical protein E6Q97_00910 [Desulfurellales bacterium]
MTRKIYVVIGETGEYSDREEWTVRAFTSEKRAKDFILMLDNWLRENGKSYRESRAVHVSGRYNTECPHDPRFQVDYTGTRYYLDETELEEESDEKD